VKRGSAGPEAGNSQVPGQPLGYPAFRILYARFLNLDSQLELAILGLALFDQ
jgi:hypothetical protein